MNEQVEIFEEDDHLWTTSRDVARNFKKRHDNVLTAFDILTKSCSKEFALLNFKVGSYLDSQNQSRRMLKMTRGGFSMLVMGFTGKKAIYWKEMYIKAFDTMEQAILQLSRHHEMRGVLAWQEARSQGKVARRTETDTIQDFVEYATSQGSKSANLYFMNITKMTYRALSLVEKGLKIPNGLRDLLSGMELSFLTTAEYICSKALAEGMARKMYYRDIYVLCKERVEIFAETVKPAQLN